MVHPPPPTIGGKKADSHPPEQPNGTDVNDPAAPKPIISPPNTVSIDNIIAGCKVFVQKSDEETRAEVLSIRQVNKRYPRSAAAQSQQNGNANGPESNLEFYVHFVGWNKVSRGAACQRGATTHLTSLCSGWTNG